MSNPEEFPKTCPSCGSFEYHVRKEVRMIVSDVWGKGGSNRKRFEMWPCMNIWHEEGLDRESEELWANMSESERVKYVKENKELLKKFGFRYTAPEGYD